MRWPGAVGERGWAPEVWPCVLRRHWRLPDAPPQFLSFTPSSQCDFLGEWLEEKERVNCRKRSIPAACLSPTSFLPARCSVVISTVSALISPPLLPQAVRSSPRGPARHLWECAPTHAPAVRRVRPVHLSRRGPPLALPPSPSLVLRFSALSAVLLAVRPLPLALYPQTGGLEAF